jgi:RHS repeat-associated protein
VNYAYDDLYRLTSETISGGASQNGTVGYQYDSVGNRLQRNSTVPAIPATGLLHYDANDRVSTDPYDNNGNLLSAGAGSNVYDFENRLVQAGGVILTYDGDGNRVSEAVAGVTTRYLVADQNLTGYAQVLDELQGANITRTYSYGLELISERQTIGGTSATGFYGYDGHGSVRFLTDTIGAITDTYTYDAFGNLLSQTGSTPNNYLFAGEQFDPVLGIYYNRARYYDQRQGIFWTMDIHEGGISDPVQLHRYLYASANPVNRLDPSGLEDLASLSVGEGISEELDSTAAAEDFAAKRAIQAKIFDAYFVIGPSNFRSFANTPIVHAFIYMDTIGLGTGTRYDVGLDLAAGPFSSAVLGVGEGFVQRSSGNLAEIKSAPLTFAFKVATLSSLQRLAWEGTVQALPVDTTSVSVPYSIVNMIAGTNCIKWTVEAAFAAVVASKIGN